MSGDILLSASIPDPLRDVQYHESADRVAIRDAVRALVTVAWATHRIVWGGHPAITPLIRAVGDALEGELRDRVRLYQSGYFAGQFPQENQTFEDVVIVPAAVGGLEESLLQMRTQMLTCCPFRAAVFIGGMEGVETEFDMVRRLQPNVPCFPVASTGAAARRIFDRHPSEFDPELLSEYAYASLFRRLLGI